MHTLAIIRLQGILHWIFKFPFEDFDMLIGHTQVTTYISFYFYILITNIAEVADRKFWPIIHSN